MSRPKESFAGLLNLLFSASQSRKLRQNSSALSVSNQTLKHIQAGVEFTHDYIEHIDSKIDLLNQNQMETALIAIQNSLQTQEVITGLVGIKSEVEKLSNNTWSILAKMNDFEKKDEIMSTLNLFLIEVEEELERIDELSHDYPVFASVLFIDLHNLIVQNEVTIDKFKRLRTIDDIKWAKSVIRNVHKQKEETEVRLNSDKSYFENYKTFNTSVDIIIRMESEIKPLLKASKQIKTQFIEQSNLLGELESFQFISDSSGSKAIGFALKKVVESDKLIKELRIKKENQQQIESELEEKIDTIQRNFEHDLANLTITKWTSSLMQNQKMTQIKRSKSANLKKKMEQDIEDLKPNITVQEIQNSIDRRINKLKHELEESQKRAGEIKRKLKLAKDKHSSLRKQHENNSKQIYQREQDIVENWQILTNYLPNNSIDLRDLNPGVEYPNSKDL